MDPGIGNTPLDKMAGYHLGVYMGYSLAHPERYGLVQYPGFLASLRAIDSTPVNGSGVEAAIATKPTATAPKRNAFARTSSSRVRSELSAPCSPSRSAPTVFFAEDGTLSHYGNCDDFIWDVHLLRPGRKPPVMGRDFAFQVTHVNWVEVRWFDTSTLEIRYEPHQEEVYPENGPKPGGIRLKLIPVEPSQNQ